ncbi:MAG: DNA polymerase III subunit delta [Chloroflexi bacterium]|nr:DNA polymerase III subunit delta [Chloroflexota bacterium]
MVYLLYGQDDFSRAQFLAQLKQELDPANGGLLPANTNVLPGPQLTFGELVQMCDSYPFLAERRLVIVEGLLSRFERRPGEREGTPPRAAGDLAQWKQSLAEYLPRMPPTTVLVFVDGPLRRSNPLLQVLSPLAQVVEFAPLRVAELQEWTVARVKQAGGSIHPQAVQLLAELAGPDLWSLSTEVDKLLTYSQSRPITAGDVQRLVPEGRQATVFAFVDALLEGPRSQALVLLHSLFLGGAVSPYLVAMVSRQLRLLLQAQELITQGRSRQEIGTHLGLAPFPLRKTWEHAHRLGRDRLVVLYDQLLDLEVAIKTGRLPDEIAWQVLVAEVSPS